jgi:hypothetical protein
LASRAENATVNAAGLVQGIALVTRLIRWGISEREVQMHGELAR